MNRASDLAVQWQKSSYSSNGGNCVELGRGFASAAPIRDSKDPEGPALMFSPEAWAAFLAAVKADEFPA